MRTPKPAAAPICPFFLILSLAPARAFHGYFLRSRDAAQAQKRARTRVIFLAYLCRSRKIEKTRFAVKISDRLEIGGGETP